MVQPEFENRDIERGDYLRRWNVLRPGEWSEGGGGREGRDVLVEEGEDAGNVQGDVLEIEECDSILLLRDKTRRRQHECYKSERAMSRPSPANRRS